MRRVLMLAIALVACDRAGGSSGLDASLEPDASPAGGPEPGPADTHCTTSEGAPIVQHIDEGACYDAAPDPRPPGEPLYNGAGDDVDCKYHLGLAVTPDLEADVQLVLSIARKAEPTEDWPDGLWVTQATVRAELSLDETHPVPATEQIATETSAGIY